jgi:hypothetical protein
MKSADLALILTGVLLNAVAQLLLKAGSRAVAGIAFNLGNTGALFERMALNPPILAGLTCYAVSAEQLSATRLIGIGIIIVGCWLVARS